MARPDNYILKLNDLKNNIIIQIMHCHKTLNELESIKLDSEYTNSAVQLEKDNIDTIIALITNGIAALETITWS